MSEAKWYIIHTYSGYENKVASNIETVVDNRGLRHLIEEVMVPVEVVTEEKDGKVRQVETKLFPCYVYVKMVMTDESWYICRNTRGVTGFVGPGSKPVPLTDEEVASLGVERKPAEISFATGEIVKIVAGALEGFEGKVQEIDKANGTVQVTVSMFGRETPATIEIANVQKI